MKLCILSITAEGRQLAERIAAELPNCDVLVAQKKIADTMRDVWYEYQGIICIMATGIVVRSIAPLLQDKTSDPCIVVVDQRGHFAISMLSGHLGGGNVLADKVATITGGQSVITTASDVIGATALDLWARRNGLIVTDRMRLTEKSAKLVDGAILTVFSELPLLGLPLDLKPCDNPEDADIVISCNKNMTSSGLCCIPENLYLGVGCNRGTSVTDIEQSFIELCDKHQLDTRAIAGIATIDVKNDETGILDFAKKRNVDPTFFTRDELNGVGDVSYSAAVMKAVGAKGVAEPASLLAAGANGHEAQLIIRKMKWKDVTLAVAKRIKNRWA
ncbi:cobalt-precorrin 5A hydrolase [Desulfopila aestuarii]|uniref:Cobalt-precorrin 5A acetaldehyde-lyase n=1 Tax=Desulfopila aestuarii DSM 18488 TaxID=1121416 RepID=A0A1M7YC08_9BACT|nr:cobalt-precorrin 5A hydrolase [Desulfopila aestuarii]SHO50131.1 cobalt-precorrin 5A acetaldehyde-lyase [Desulfopila aestuarii DSM 18488]